MTDLKLYELLRRRRALGRLLSCLGIAAPLSRGLAEEPSAGSGGGGDLGDQLNTDSGTDSGTDRERQLQSLREHIERQRAELERARELSHEVQEDIDSLRRELDESESRLREKRDEVERLRQRTTLGDE